jgi:protein-S-isoprenylcysteine O-methyltransferase Ste14
VLWLRSALFTIVMPGTATVAVPLWLSSASDGRWDLGPLRWAGLVPMVAGAAGLLWCVWDFARRGKGTLAPVDPPQLVVRSGLYQVVRNPMYVSVVAILGGEILVLRSPAVALWAAFVAVAFHRFVVGYEEPTLRRQFGAAYEAYCREVPRWWPRRRGRT